jgi:putative hydrolase of the HAD superfamily
MLPFDVILFDVGGVLLTNGWDHKERAIVARNFGLDLEEFEARHPEANDHWEKDETTAREYLDATVFYEPRTFTHDDFLNAILEQSVPIPETGIPVLKDLAASGKYLLGALNNEAREPNEYRFDTFGLRQLFRVALSSCYLGMRKPNPEIYKRAIDILGVKLGRILFIDDRQSNVDFAADSGLKAILFTGETNLRRQLKELEVLDSSAV